MFVVKREKKNHETEDTRPENGEKEAPTQKRTPTQNKKKGPTLTGNLGSRAPRRTALAQTHPNRRPAASRFLASQSRQMGGSSPRAPLLRVGFATLSQLRFLLSQWSGHLRFSAARSLGRMLASPLAANHLKLLAGHQK